jgi:kynurenine formamidase
MDCIESNLILEDIDFILFKTSWEKVYGTPEYFSVHPQFTVELGQWLAASSLKGIGMDMPSPDVAPYPIHQLVLGAGKVLIENLRGLDKLPENQIFQLICIPLPIDAEAVWVRPLAILP